MPNPVKTTNPSSTKFKKLAILLAVGLAMPQVSFAASQLSGSPLFGCGPLTTNFVDASSVAGPDTITGWDWDFGDGNTSTAQNPNHTYQTPGLYTVSLTASSALAAALGTDTNVNYVQVIGPATDFTSAPLAGSSPHEVFFTDLTVFGAPITGWAWDFGDGGNSALQNPDHTYTVAGIYEVSLTVTDIDGCDRTETKSTYITVSAGPVDDLAVTSGGGQNTYQSNAFGNALVATIEDASDNPVAGENVTFTAPAAGASGTFASTGTNTETVATDVNGQATSSIFTANSTVGGYNVAASSGGLTPVDFALTNTSSAGVPDNLAASAGSGQSAIHSTAFGNALVATIIDPHSDPVAGENVTFTAPAAGASGTFASTGTNTEIVVTDVGGQATSSVFTANATLGSYNITATSGALTAVNFALTNNDAPPLPAFDLSVVPLSLNVGERIRIALAENAGGSSVVSYDPNIVRATKNDSELILQAIGEGFTSVISVVGETAIMYQVRVLTVDLGKQVPALPTVVISGEETQAVIHAGVSTDGSSYFTEGIYSAGERIYLLTLIDAEVDQLGARASVLVALENLSNPGVFYLLSPDGSAEPFDESKLVFFTEVVLGESAGIHILGEGGLLLSGSEVGRFNIYIGYQLESEGPIFHTNEAIVIEIID